MNTQFISKTKLLLLAFGMSIASSQTWAVTDIRTCSVINQPGSYRVTNDLAHLTSKVSSQCILIDANDVTLDLQGHTITGDGSGLGITVPGNSSLSNIQIRNGTVRSFERGIYLLEVKSPRIEQMRVYGNTNIGILVENEERPNVGAMVIDNIAFENLSGIVVGSDSLVRGNVANYNRFRGISVLCPSLVSDNTAISNSNANISLAFTGCRNSNNVAPPVVR